MSTPDTRESYLTAYKGFTSNGGGVDPAWLKSLREQGIGQFSELGFPSTKLEDWRFTSVKQIVDSNFELGTGGELLPADEIELSYGMEPAARSVSVNGVEALGGSVVNGLPKDVIVTSLATAVREYPDLVRGYLGRFVNGDTNAFAALNTAFARCGSFVYVPDGVSVDGFIEILNIMRTNGSQIVAHPRTLVVVEKGAQVRIVETFGGIDAGRYLTNAVTEVIVGDGASVDLFRVQRESPNGFHVATTYSTQGRDSRYAMHTVPLGSRLTRHDVRMVLDGEGGHGTLNGLYVIQDNQHVDHNTVIEHAKPHCESHEYFNGILDDSAHSVFNGRIIVQPGAQKTDSKQTNNNLLLSEDARADSQPQLEIYADDVRCTHGATLGPLDDNALFYLQARGIDAASAKRMLTMGFGMEVLSGIELPSVRQRLEALVKDRLVKTTSVAA